MNREAPSDSYQVEFYPSADDYVYIVSRLTNATPRPQLVTSAYQVFLIVNAVAFPAFLWLLEFYSAGLFVLILNAVLLYWILPWIGAAGAKDFYRRTFGDRENHVVTVELNAEGLVHSSENGSLFLPWHRITVIEESDDAVFFFFEGNGVAVRKSGFPYRDAQVAFTNFARGQLANAQENLLEK